MLYAQFVRAYTYTLRIHITCMPLLVWRMSFIHTLHYMLHYYMIVYFPFSFSNFSFWVYTNCIHNYVYCISLEFHWNITYWHMLPGHFNKYTPGIYCILLEFQHITGLISRGWYSEVYSSHFISLLHDRILPLLLHLYYVHRVHIACVDIVTLVSRIRNVYIWYIYGIHLSINSI